MSSKQTKRCPCCNAKIVEYRHNLGRGIVDALITLYEAGGTSHLLKLNLTRNQLDNFQKLRYWGLAAKTYDERGKRINGVWHITQTGREFVENKKAMHRNVWTYRGEFVRFDAETVMCRDVEDVHYKQKPQYSFEAKLRPVPDMFIEG